MAIERDDADGSEGSIREGTNKHEILSFLAEYRDKAFTRAEIADRTSVGENSVGSVLARLRESGAVKYSNGYYAISETFDTDAL